MTPLTLSPAMAKVLKQLVGASPEERAQVLALAAGPTKAGLRVRGLIDDNGVTPLGRVVVGVGGHLERCANGVVAPLAQVLDTFAADVGVSRYKFAAVLLGEFVRLLEEKTEALVASEDAQDEPPSGAEQPQPE